MVYLPETPEFSCHDLTTILLQDLKVIDGSEELKGEKNHFTGAGLMPGSMVKNALKPKCTS